MDTFPYYRALYPHPNQRRVHVLYPHLPEYFVRGLIIQLIWVLGDGNKGAVFVDASECIRRNHYPMNLFNFFSSGTLNRTIGCDAIFQWTVADYCCYDKYDRYFRSPFCCHSEVYKLIVAVGLICLMLLGSSFFIFFCWLYNLPHYILYWFTCGKFHLNNWLISNPTDDGMRYFSGEPFWSKRAELQPYPLRPMPAKIFYPAPLPKFKPRRWDSEAGEIPLFVIASRQFTRRPYSSRPVESDVLQTPKLGVPNSSDATKDFHRNGLNPSPGCGNGAVVPYQNGSTLTASPVPFHLCVSERQAVDELLEALKIIDEDDGTSGWNLPTAEEMTTQSPPKGNPRGGGIYTISGSGRIHNIALTNGSLGEIPGGSQRPQATLGGQPMNQFRNYISLASIIPNVNYHVMPSQMETILEDGIDTQNTDGNNNKEDDQDIPLTGNSSYDLPASSRMSGLSHGNCSNLLKRRATLTAIYQSTANVPSMSRVVSAMDHVVVPTPTTKAVVPFSPTLPNTLPEATAVPMDTAFVEAVMKQNEPRVLSSRRNSFV